MNRLFALLWLVLAVFILQARAQTADDQYVRIYNLVQQADSLNNLSQPAEALPKYLEAQAALQRFQKLYPDWNEKVVRFRLNYVTAKIGAITTKVPAATTLTATNLASPSGARLPATTPVPGKPVASESDPRLPELQEEVRRLQADKSVLEAKLKEALATQPAAIDPRELTKAKEKIQSLLKETDLLKTSLAQEQAKPAPGADLKLVKETEQVFTEKLAVAEKKLAEANRKLGEQTEAAQNLNLEKQVLLSRVRTLTASAEAGDALRAENALLKKQVADSKSATPAASGPTEMGRQLAQADVRIAALQSDAEILRLEKIALQNRLKQMAAAPVTTIAIPPASTSQDAERVKRLELERDDLQKKLESANKELFGRKGKEVAARIDELSDEITTLRARLEVFEARAVPYKAEELALFKQVEFKLAATDPNAARKSVKELPPGATPLVAEAQRHFSAKEFDKAHANYLELLRQDDKNVYTLANLAAIELELNRLVEAEKHVNEALAVAPDDGYSLSILGYLKFRQEKYDEALDALSRAARIEPQNAEIQNYLGVTLNHKGMRGPAETALRKAIQLDPGYGGAHNNLAVMYVSQHPPLVELARWHYQKALAANHPRNAELEKMLEQRSAAGNGP